MKSTSKFSAESIRASDRGYTAYHAPRYAFLLRLLAELGVTKASRILDVGPSRLTELIGQKFGAAVDSLGFGPDRAAEGGRHFEFDLNAAQDEARWRRDLPQYEIVVMAEVLEHLYTAPELVLAFVKTLLVEDGLLILQTPNAAALQKRVKLVLGRNPYEMIRVTASNPGHFREYTLSELRRLAEELGFRVERCATAFYFDARFARHLEGRVRPEPALGMVKNILYRAFPKSMREGITMVWRKTG